MNKFVNNNQQIFNVPGWWQQEGDKQNIYYSNELVRNTGISLIVFSVVSLCFLAWFFVVCLKAFKLVNVISKGGESVILSGLPGGKPSGSYGAV